LTEDELELAERAYDEKIRMVTPRNEMATYTSLKQMFISKMKAEKAMVTSCAGE
jgi:hypothetical protein